MNKTELVAAVADATNVTKKEAETLINSTLEQITGELQSGGQVQLVGFGTFTIRQRTERIGKNPRTGEQMAIAGCTVPTFKPGKALKEAVNRKTR